MDGIPFLLPVELTPLQTRAKSVAIATCFFWLCSKFITTARMNHPDQALIDFFVVMISPVLISRITYGTYALWASTNFVFVPLIYFLSMSLHIRCVLLLSLTAANHCLVPETMKADLEDIDVLFETNPTWLIGPGSAKRLADIIANREERNLLEKHVDESKDKEAVLIEDTQM